MRSVWDALRKGNAKERLAVVADLVSIVGVSLGSMFAAVLAVKGKVDVDVAFIVAAAGFLSLAVAAARTA